MHIKGFPVEKKKQTTILNEAAAKIKIKLYQGNQLLCTQKKFHSFSDRQVFTVICNNRW